MEYKIRWLDDHLEHHGILGMKWGVRRYQNPDGSLTAEGKKRYSKSSDVFSDIVNKHDVFSRTNTRDFTSEDRSVRKKAYENWVAYRDATASVKYAFPGLKKKFEQANELAYQLDNADENKIGLITTKVNEIAEAYSKDVQKIFSPYKEDVPYDVYKYVCDTVVEDFWDNLYGYGR